MKLFHNLLTIDHFYYNPLIFTQASTSNQCSHSTHNFICSINIGKKALNWLRKGLGKIRDVATKMTLLIYILPLSNTAFETFKMTAVA